MPLDLRQTLFAPSAKRKSPRRSVHGTSPSAGGCPGAATQRPGGRAALARARGRRAARWWKPFGCSVDRLVIVFWVLEGGGLFCWNRSLKGLGGSVFPFRFFRFVEILWNSVVAFWFHHTSIFLPSDPDNVLVTLPHPSPLLSPWNLQEVNTFEAQRTSGDRFGKFSTRGPQTIRVSWWNIPRERLWRLGVWSDVATDASGGEGFVKSIVPDGWRSLQNPWKIRSVLHINRDLLGVTSIWKSIENLTFQAPSVHLQHFPQVVIPYWTRWMRRFPTVHRLAEASPEEVNGLWAGLGFYGRARRLHEGAKHVVTKCQGQVPSEVSALREIPGVGPYTAGVGGFMWGWRSSHEIYACFLLFWDFWSDWSWNRSICLVNLGPTFFTNSSDLQNPLQQTATLKQWQTVTNKSWSKKTTTQTYTTPKKKDTP